MYKYILSLYLFCIVSTGFTQEHSGVNNVPMKAEIASLQVSALAKNSMSEQSSSKSQENDLPIPVLLNASSSAIDTMKYVGEIPIQYALSPTGAVTYNVPIDIVPEPSEFQPMLSLSYSSQSGVGLAGWGWNISGLSVISRTNKNYYYDAATEGVSQNGDTYSLDGMRLIKTGNNQYVTEQGHIKVDKINNREFTVRYPNGNVATYKSNADDSLYFPLASITDLNNNIIRYHYEYKNNSYYITRIEYGLSSQGENFFASVEFIYDPLVAENTIYIAGLALKNERLLSKINVLYRDNPSPLRTYRLTYDHKKVDYLTQIDCVADGGMVNPIKLTYGYEGSGYEYFSSSKVYLTKYFNNTVQDSRGGRKYLRMKRGRFSLDSKNDGMITYIGYPTYHLNRWNTKGNKEFGTDYHADSQIAVYKELKEYTYIDPVLLVMGAGFQTISVEDINGDGKDEIVKINYQLLNSTTAQITVTKYNSATMSPTSRTFNLAGGNVNDGSYNSPIHCEFIFGDFIGNGKSQLLAITSCRTHKNDGKDYRGSKALLIDVDNSSTVYNGSFFDYTNFQLNYESQIRVSSDLIFPIDYDGNGKAEICHIAQDGVHVYTFTDNQFKEIARQKYSLSSKNSITSNSFNFDDVELLLGDINGDGKTDLALTPRASQYTDGYKHLGSDLCCGACQGGTLVSTSNDGYKTYRNSLGTCTVDPSIKARTISTDNNGKSWLFMLSTGDPGYMTASDPDKGFAVTRRDLMYHMADLSGPSFMLIDADNDGLSDLIVNHKGEVSLYLNKNGAINKLPEPRATLTVAIEALLAQFNFNMSHYWTGNLICVKDGVVTPINYSKDETYERAVREVVNSSGVCKRHVYADLGNTPYRYSVTGTSPSFPYNKMHQKYYAGCMTDTYVGNKKIESLDYKYADGVVHRQGLGFQGFRMIETTDWIRNRTSVLTFDPLRFGVLESSVSPLDSTVYKYNIRVSPNKTRDITLAKSSVKDKLKGYVTTSAYEYDQYGNPTSEEIKYGGYVQSKTTTTYLNMDESSKYRLGLLTCKEEIDTRLDQSVTRRTNIIYYPSLLPQTIQSYYNDNFVDGITYVYNGRGKMTSETTRSYSSPNTRTTQYQYDEFGRVTATTDPMLFTNTSGYSSTNGLVEFVQDHWGRRTEYEYDNWGRLIRSRHPDGVISSSQMKWNDDPEIDALYVSVSSETGKPVHKTYYDQLGREIRIAESRFNGKYLKTDKVYDEWGRLAATSLPYTAEEATIWDSYNYDLFDRLTSIEYASGKKDSVSYNLSSVTNIVEGIATTKTYDASGQMISVEDPGGVIKYYYRADGQLSSILAPGDVITQFEYDEYGRQTVLNDPSAGRKSYQYDESGNVKAEIDAKGRTTRMYYDNYDRMVRKEIVGEMNTNFYYDPGTALLKRVSDNNHTTTYVYDNLDRLKIRKDSIVDNKWLERTYRYNNGNLSRVEYKTQSSGGNTIAAKDYVYRNGHLCEIGVNNTAIWKLVDENNMGVPSQALTGAIQRYYDYDIYGMPVSRRAIGANGTIQNYSYKFDHNTNNLLWRKDEVRGIKEDFSYDYLNRLVSFGDSHITYDREGKGNIVANSSIGQFTYGTHKPYQLIGAVDQGNQIPLRDQDVVYNTMQRPVSITEHEYNALFTYDSDGNRVRMQVNENDMGILSRYYIDKTYEIESGVGIDKEFLYLDGDAYSASSVYVKENGSWNINYICRDYLGSITHLTDANGVVLQENSYDAWGRLRNPQTQVLYNDDNRPDLFLRRGYTSHEHLPWFGLTNMNARLYDPVLGRFLSPDPYVQMPDFSQSFNRYAYAHNNPLKFTDPSGETPLLAAIILGAVIGGMANLNIQALAGNINSYGDMFASFGMGALAGGLAGAAGAAVSGLVAGAYSTAATTSSQFIFRGALAGASGGIAGGFVGGAVTAWGNGASFVDGLKVGGISAGIGGLLGGLSGGIGGAKQFNSIKLHVANIDGSTISTDRTGQLVKSDHTLNEFSDTYFRDVRYRDQAVLKYDHETVKAHKSTAWAHTDPNKINGKFVVRFANEAFQSKLDMFLVMGHEYVHVSQLASALPFNSALYEYGAYQWNRNVLNNSGMQNNSWYSEASQAITEIGRNPGMNIRVFNSNIRYFNPQTNRLWGLPTIIPAAVR